MKTFMLRPITFLALGMFLLSPLGCGRALFSDFRFSNIHSGQVLTGDAPITASIRGGAAGLLDLAIDGQVLGGQNEEGPPSNRVCAWSIPTAGFPNGRHVLTIQHGKHVYDTCAVVFQNMPSARARKANAVTLSPTMPDMPTRRYVQSLQARQIAVIEIYGPDYLHFADDPIKITDPRVMKALLDALKHAETPRPGVDSLGRRSIGVADRCDTLIIRKRRPKLGDLPPYPFEFNPRHLGIVLRAQVHARRQQRGSDRSFTTPQTLESRHVRPHSPISYQSVLYWAPTVNVSAPL